MNPAALRSIPPVNEVVEIALGDGRAADLPRALVVEAARQVIDEHRDAVRGGAAHAGAAALAERAAQQLEREQRPALRAVINATGIVLHTGLGRAPLGEGAVRALLEAAGRYVPVELDLDSGGRGRRSSAVAPLIRRLCGAEAATVVNNNAAALVVVLAALARDREVIVSRGELIEIGGSFRLPEVMGAGGAILREVGTTNRTRLADYERAAGEHTAALLKVHTSNYRIEGFAEAVSIEALAALGRRLGLPVIDDIGSGALHDPARCGLGGDEPHAARSIAAGADLVLFSGDKLLGGPQAGVIAGRRELVETVERHPLMRAMRIDKLRLAALEATLRAHFDPVQAVRELPALALMTTSAAALEQRGRRIVERLRACAALEVELVESIAHPGGGSLPAEALPSRAIVLRPRQATDSAVRLARRLRLGRPAVIGRIAEGAVHLDLRALFEDQDDALCAAVEQSAAAQSIP